MTDTDRRRTKGRPWPDCLSDAQLMDLLRRRMPERFEQDPEARRQSLDHAIAVVERFMQKTRAMETAPSGSEGPKSKGDGQ